MFTVSLQPKHNIKPDNRTPLPIPIAAIVTRECRLSLHVKIELQNGDCGGGSL